MGIAGLNTFLQPFGTRIELVRDDSDYVCPSLVIDGPALAYNLWRQERLKEGDYRRYRRILEAHIKTLQKFFQISVIYFDGFLPNHKKDIRLARASANAERVRKNTGSLVHSTPPPAFVVTLTQDVARHVGIQVTVVLEEADTACARETNRIAKDTGKPCYLMSLDSDLHCFDLGSLGYYLPLDTVLMAPNVLTATAYNFARTQSALGVSILELACVMGAEGSQEISIPASVAHKALQSGCASLQLAELRRVKALFSMSRPKSCAYNPVHKLAMQGRLYGRICESIDSGEVWLPQLLEDSAKASAWSNADHIRAQAYYILNDAHGSKPGKSYTEWFRRSERVSAKDITSDDGRTGARNLIPQNKKDFFVSCLQYLIDARQQCGDNLTQVEFHAFLVMFFGSYNNDVIESSTRTLHLMATWQAIIFSMTILCQARGNMDYPLISDLYDLQTFLKACELLQGGHLLATLTRAHATEVAELQSILHWVPLAMRKAKKRRS